MQVFETCSWSTAQWNIPTLITRALCSLVPRPHPDSISQLWRKIPIFLHSCEIKSGWGLGTRLSFVYGYLVHVRATQLTEDSISPADSFPWYSLSPFSPTCPFLHSSFLHFNLISLPHSLSLLPCNPFSYPFVLFSPFPSPLIPFFIHPLPFPVTPSSTPLSHSLFISHPLNRSSHLHVFTLSLAYSPLPFHYTRHSSHASSLSLLSHFPHSTLLCTLLPLLSHSPYCSPPLAHI